MTDTKINLEQARLLVIAAGYVGDHMNLEPEVQKDRPQIKTGRIRLVMTSGAYWEQVGILDEGGMIDQSVVEAWIGPDKAAE